MCKRVTSGLSYHSEEKMGLKKKKKSCIFCLLLSDAQGMHGLGKSGFHKVEQKKIRLMLLRWQAEMLGIIMIQIKPLVFFPIAVALNSISHSLPVCLPACLFSRFLHHIIQLYVSLSTFPLGVCSFIVFSSTNHAGLYSGKYKAVVIQFINPQHC